MKRFTVTPRLDTLTLFFAGLLFCLSFASVFSQESDTTQMQTGEKAFSAKELYRIHVQNHIISKSDTIGVFITRVIDGDTFVCVTCEGCDDSLRIRVLELDTFEKARIPRLYKQASVWGITPEEALYAGKITTIEARKILQSKQVKLHRGSGRNANIDIYDRPLRYVVLPDGTDYSELMRSRGFNARK